MQLELRKLRKQDHKKAIQCAITGMHFDWYMDSPWLLDLYGRYFWYMELTRATQILAAYRGDEFAGVMLCAVKGEKRQYHSLWKQFYVKLVRILQEVFVKDGPGVYNEANEQMFENYCRQNEPDGEILFLAANPDIGVKGIGSFLLKELEKREPGKKIYLYTDNACTYPFYEHRGFERSEEKDIVLDMGKKKVDLRCFLYSKILGDKTVRG